MNVALPIALVAIAAVAASGGSKRSRGASRDPLPGGELPSPINAGQDDLRYLARMAGLDDEWVIFLEGVARGESGFDNLVGLGAPGMFPPWAAPNENASFQTQQNEADAAAVIFDRAKSLHACTWPRARYVFGSGGWFGMIPASGLAVFNNTLYQCLDPWSVFDPAASLVMALGYAQRVMGWANFKPKTWLNLRVGWGNPSNMGKQSVMNEIAGRFGEKLEDLGYPPSFMYRNVTPLPAYSPVDLLDSLWEVY